MKRFFSLPFGTLLLLILSATSLAGGFDTNIFPADDLVKKRVDFWVKIYTDFSTHEGVIHDSNYPEIIVEKMDFRIEETDLSIPAKQREKKVQNRIKDVKEFYRQLFLSIHKKQSKLPDKEIPSPDLSLAEKRMFDLYKDIKEHNKFYLAAHPKRLRLQRGLRDRFIQGLFYAGRYLPAMEKIFADRGVPVEITRLPFVESSFNIRARSKVGASGIWQFMRSTGKVYMKINETVDERNDPLRATEAAAELLKHNYESLGSWPLGITAYNHGRKGLMRAVRKVGTESLSELITGYRSRNFGFASSNFYAEFLAALEVERNSERYFGPVERENPVPFAEFVMNDFVSLSDIAIYTRIPMESLIDLNHGLTENVLKGRHLVPAGYVLKIPLDTRDQFLTRYNEIPESKKFNRQKSLILQAVFR